MIIPHLCFLFKSKKPDGNCRPETSVSEFYAGLHDRDDMFDRILAVIFQPFVDDGDQTTYIKGHHICPILRRNMKALKDRCEYVAVQRQIRLIYFQSGRLLESGTELL